MNRISKVENIILDFIEKRKDILFLAAISILALAIRIIFKDFKSTDFEMFLNEWCNYLEINGGFKALGTIESDYNFIYLYFLAFFTYIPGSYLIKVKGLSIIFDFLAAFGAYLITLEVLKNNKNKRMVAAIVYSILLFLPTVIMNGAVWAQCDIIYSTFIIFSLYCILKNKNIAAFILYGVALTFKLQAILVFPVYIILYLKNRNFSVLNFLWIPIVNIICFIPALIMGKPLSAILSAYFTQMGEYPFLVLNYPNVYNLISGNESIMSKAGIVFTVALFGVITFIIISSKEKIEGGEIIHLSALSILLAVYFLPHMHERYAFCGELLLVIYYILKRKNIFIPVALIFLITNNYLQFLNSSVLIQSNVIASLVQLAIILFVFTDFLRENNFLYDKKTTIETEDFSLEKVI